MRSNNILNIYWFDSSFKFCFCKFSLFSVVSRVNKFIFFQPSFIVFHSYYEWNNNTILPLYDNCISFEMRWIFSNSIQSNSQCDIEEYHFVFDEFWKRLSFLSYSFKRDVTWQTSFLFTTKIILPTTKEYFQQWLYCQLPSFNTFSSSNNLSRHPLSPLIPSSPF